MSFPTKPVLLVTCALASLAFAACGGSGSKTNASAKTDNEQQLVNFTRCMREHGVNVSTPNAPGVTDTVDRSGAGTTDRTPLPW